MGWSVTKAHAYGNDFVYISTAEWDAHDWPAIAREMCARQTGAGADGLIIYEPSADGARMRLFNADGSAAEVSGNGVRGLAALVCWSGGRTGFTSSDVIRIETDAGPKMLELLATDGPRMTFRAAMGPPEDLHCRTVEVAGEFVDIVIMRVGNPQCVVLEPVLDERRYRRLGPLLEHHPVFGAGTNVEFAQVESVERVRILIWERGVGPTLASGTGACAAAVAAMAYGGVSRSAEVVSPGGTQRVEWLDDGLYLTGWAEVVWEGRWIR
jgi:diaminopimelate epimerase